MMKPARPLSRSASASQVNSLPFRRTFVGAGGGVVSVTFVSFTYCIHALAIGSFGSQRALAESPVNFAAGVASAPPNGASHAPSAGIGCSDLPGIFGRRADRQAS